MTRIECLGHKMKGGICVHCGVSIKSPKADRLWALVYIRFKNRIVTVSEILDGLPPPLPRSNRLRRLLEERAELMDYPGKQQYYKIVERKTT